MQNKDEREKSKWGDKPSEWQQGVCYGFLQAGIFFAEAGVDPKLIFRAFKEYERTLLDPQ